MTVYDDENVEIDLKQDYDDEEDAGFVNEDEFDTVNDMENADGYQMEESDDEFFSVPSLR